MTTPYYVDDGSQTHSHASFASAQEHAAHIADETGQWPAIFRPHDVGEYCECGECEPAPWDWQELCCPHGAVSGEHCSACGDVPDPEEMHDPANVSRWDAILRQAHA